jgi:hypothetical protein
MLGRQRIGKLRVSEYVPNRIIALQASLGQIAAAQIRYSFEPVEDRTRMTSTAEVELHGAWKLITPLLSPMLERDNREDMANIKRIMEVPA